MNRLPHNSQRSTDGGHRWRRTLAAPAEADCTFLAAAGPGPARPPPPPPPGGRVLAAVDRSLWLSDDCGVTWREAGRAPPLGLAVDGPGTLDAGGGGLVVAGGGRRVLSTVDGGATWAAAYAAADGWRVALLAAAGDLV
jgi:hypothetical protein